MKIAIFSDIHSNPDAFDAAYLDASKIKNVDKIMCLGDVVGYGPEPIESIRKVKSLCEVCVMGNHDAAIVGKLSLDWFSQTAKSGILRQRDLIASSKDDFDWLNDRPYTHVFECDGLDIEIAHGTNVFPDEFEYITCSGDSKYAFEKMNRTLTNILFIGHTHEALWISQEIKDWNYDFYRNYPEYGVISGNSLFDIESNKRYVFNAGSIGYPRIHDEIVYCILDTDKKNVEYVFLPFDFKSYIEKMKSKNIPLPSWMWRI